MTPVTQARRPLAIGPRKGRPNIGYCAAMPPPAMIRTRLLTGQQPPFLMVTDPPYGVDLEPEWREEAGLNPRTRQGGKVANDDRVDWSEAWALFPGDVAYVWHAGIHARRSERWAAILRIRNPVPDHLGEAAFCHLARRLSLAP